MTIFYPGSYDTLTPGNTSRRHSPLHTSTLSVSPFPIIAVSKPKLNLHENPELNLITATLELPGIPKENVQLTIQNNTLVLTTETSSSHDARGYTTRERFFGKLSRSLTLPQGITEEDVSASMADGVLTITYPLLSPELEPKRIPIA